MPEGGAGNAVPAAACQRQAEAVLCALYRVCGVGDKLMSGNLRKKLSGRSGCPTEAAYERARRQVIRQSTICHFCGHPVDKSLKPICRFVDVAGFGVTNAHELPTKCSEGCEHARKAHPWGPSADHYPVPVSKMPLDSPLLCDPRAMVLVHTQCNRERGTGEVRASRYSSAKNYFLE